MSRSARTGPRSDPHDGPDGRHEAPFGPEISWPNGFRQMDPESRELIESAFRPGPGYQQPAVDDCGYGDPGYSDPSYEGPSRPFAGSGCRPPDPVPGYRGPEIRGFSPRPGSAAYPEQWYDHPRLVDRAAADVRRGAADPRLEGLLTAPDTGRRGRPVPVRPGHGLDGPETTSSWPAQPAADDLDTFDDFWREDEDEEYSGLFGDRGAEFNRADAKQAAKKVTAKRGPGRRRGRSSDHRLWLGLGGVVVVAAAAIVGIIKFEFPSHSGPAHTMSAPNSIGTYARTVDMERATDLAALRAEVIMMSSGQATDVQSAVYKSGDSAAGNTEQIIMFIGGHLANADPAASIASFTQKFPGAHVAGAGPLGGEAACVEEGTSANAVALCAWFDNDSFGGIVSPTMNATALAKAMQTVRPAVEHLAPK